MPDIEQLRTILVAIGAKGIRQATVFELQQDPELIVSGDAESGSEAVEKVSQLLPEIVILDLDMPDGLHALRKILNDFSETRVLALADHYSDQVVRDAMKAGVKGFVIFETSQIKRAVNVLKMDGTYFTPFVVASVMDEFSKYDPGDPSAIQLTYREKQIVYLIAEGHPLKYIAFFLGLGRSTVGNTCNKIMRKLKLYSIPELVLYGVRTGLIEVGGISLEAVDTDAVRVRFEFPESVKTACEQYLLYFAQFLKDLGVEVEAKIEERARDVLFSVVPTDKEQALDKIRAALDAYLQMPSAPDFAVAASQFRDIAISQLQANVLHLQSQFMLAKATLEMKNAIIEAKDFEIAVLKERIDFTVFKPQLASESQGADKEPIIGDLVSVKKFDYKFLEIDFPKLLRKLKRRPR